MGDYSAYNGQKFDDGNGNTYTVTDGQFIDQNGKAFAYDPPVSVSQGKINPAAYSYNSAIDMAKQAGPATAEMLEGVRTTPAGVANWAGKGLQAVAPTVGQIAPGAAQTISTAGHKLEEGTQPYTFEPQWAEDVQRHSWLGRQPETAAGEVTRQAIGALPGALLGGEGLLPAASRAIGAGLGGTAGQYLTDSPWGQMAGSLIGFGGAPTGAVRAATPRAGMAQTLLKQGTPVSAAQKTGSGMRALLEGGPPSGQMDEISDNMLRQAGIVRPAGNTDPLSKLASDRFKVLDDQVKDLKRNTLLPYNPGLWNDLGRMDLAHTAQGTGSVSGEATTLINPQVNEAYEDFRKLAEGKQNLTGEQYSMLSQKWGNSDSPIVKEMGRRLDAEMEKANPAWTQWNDDYANYKGVRGAIDAAGGKATTQGIDPGVVNKSMYRTTEMKKYAEAAEGITGKYPEAKGGTLSAVAALLASGAGGLAGYAHGGFSGAASGAEAGLLPFALHQVQEAAGPAVNRLAKSTVGQKYLLMDPKSAAAALYSQPAVKPEGQVAK